MARYETVGYCKIRKNGTWGLRGFGLQPGQIVTVFKRNGGVETETVGPQVTAFRDGTTLHAIAGRVARGPRGNGSLSHVFTRDPYNGDDIDYSEA